MQPIVNLPYSSVSGLAVARASNTTVSVAAGQCRDSSNVFDIVVPSALTLNAAVTGANGLDTGTLGASSVYAVYVLSESTGYNSPVGLLSLSATAPLLPAGYDIFRRVGWAVTDGSSHFVIMYQHGTGLARKYFYDAAISVLSGGTSATYAAVSLAAAVPPISTYVLLQTSFVPNAANDTCAIRPSGSASTTAMVLAGNVAAKASDATVSMPCLVVSGAAKVDYLVTASGALTLEVSGFEDYL